MDYSNRPKIKDLEKRYKGVCFYLHTHPTLGCCVCFNKNSRAGIVVSALRRRGYCVIPENLSGLWETYCITTKDEKWK